MKRSFFCLTLASVTLAISAISQAAPTYKWTTDASSYTTTAGTNQVVHLYLSETGATASSGIAHENGLLSVGFKVTASSPGSIVSFAPNTTDFSVDDGSPTPTGTSAAFYAEISNARFSSNSGVNPNGSGLLDLGFITVKSTGPANAVFSITDFDSGAATPKGQTGTISGTTSLDSQIANGSFAVAVPEPTSLAGLAMLGSFILRRRRA